MSKPNPFAIGSKMAKVSTSNEETVDAARNLARDTTGVLAAAKIKARPNTDTRLADPKHVLALAESIAAVGLLEPIVIDKKDYLIAGLHRLSAVLLLLIEDDDERVTSWTESYQKAYGKAPKKDEIERLAGIDRSAVATHFPSGLVQIRRTQVNSENEPEKALALEVAENEKRRDYSREEIQDLAKRLKKAGYRATEGRPKKGQQALLPALSLIVGKSKPTLWRALRGKETVSHETVSEEDLLTRDVVKLCRAMRKVSAHKDLPPKLSAALAALWKAVSPIGSEYTDD